MAITIPSFPEDRGPIKVDPLTGSTITKPSAYCRDLKGCGDATYTVGQISMSVNQCTDCVRDFKGSASINYIVGENEKFDEAKKLIDYLMDELKAAHRECKANNSPQGFPF